MEWKRGMITLTLLVCLMCVLSYSSLLDEHSRSKRIVFGEILPSHDVYNTQFFINLRKFRDSTNFKAVKLHTPDNSSIGGEQACGGTLVHPEYVLTAAHCVSWLEVHFRNSIQLHPEDVVELRKVRVVIQRYDTILSQYVMYAGGTNWFNMTQKRHVRQIFPHLESTDPISGISGQDVAFLRACFPFRLDGKNVALVPLDIENSRKRHYDLTRKGGVCLAMGFGAAGWPQWEADARSRWNIFYAHDLRHGWSHLKCATSCPNYKERVKYMGQNCAICAVGLAGLRWHVGSTDSGGPLMCDGFFAGVLNEGGHLETIDSDETKLEWGYIEGWLHSNQSETWFYAVHCIKDYLTEKHFQYLSEISKGPDVSRKHPEFVPFNPTPDERTNRKRTKGLFL